MAVNQNPIEHIAKVIETKSAIKQETYRKLCDNFKLLEKEAKHVVSQINEKITNKDKDIVLAVKHINDQEFHLRIAGDLLIFILHTNIVALDDVHAYNKSEYVQQNASRKYLGQINVYNFLADSLKFHRLNDPGYLISRLFINYEGHFLVEGELQLNLLSERVSEKPISKIDLNIFIQLVISQSLDNDLVTSPFQSIRVISLQQKIEKSQELGSGSKIGFQMSYQNKIE